MRLHCPNRSDPQGDRYWRGNGAKRYCHTEGAAMHSSADPLGWGFIASWVGVCAAAELLGIALGGLWWAAMDRVEPEPVGLAMQLVMLALKGGSGLMEGVVLGGLQAMVLKRRYPRLAVGRWIAATSLLAVIGWTMGSSFAVFAGPAAADAPAFNPPLGLVVLLAALFGLAVGVLFGAAQALVLRRAALGAGWWIAANSIGWALALPAVYVAASSGSGEATLAEVLLRGLGGGVTAGIVLGAATALFLPKIRPQPR
jgi:hypothetical protein